MTSVSETSSPSREQQHFLQRDYYLEACRRKQTVYGSVPMGAKVFHYSKNNRSAAWHRFKPAMPRYQFGLRSCAMISGGDRAILLSGGRCVKTTGCACV